MAGLEGAAGAAGVNFGCEPIDGDVPGIGEAGARGTDTEATAAGGIEDVFIGDETRGALAGGTNTGCEYTRVTGGCELIGPGIATAGAEERLVGCIDDAGTKLEGPEVLGLEVTLGALAGAAIEL
ncbi:MAG: hypothetical protein ACP5MD_05350 [Verrucomicrobiia bacterium]